MSIGNGYQIIHAIMTATIDKQSKHLLLNYINIPEEKIVF